MTEREEIPGMANRIADAKLAVLSAIMRTQ